MDHRTRPVVIPEELDLSEIDRTLGGSVRSLPPERLVYGSRAALGLLFYFLSCRVGGPIYSIDRTLLAYSATSLIQALADHAAELSCRRSSPATRARHHLRLPVPCPSRHRICRPPATEPPQQSLTRHRASPHTLKPPRASRDPAPPEPICRALALASLFVGKARPLLPI